ncbi:MAG TPA: class I SAM-dependent methyltransferase [Verrucomicrobiae bacterium]|nr:class I SAM-dependent methyltransferase [Verrucomicrobiae bacterium]
MLRRLVDFCAGRTAIYDRLRNWLEGDFRMQAEVIAGEGLPECGRVIDVGCGTATFARLFDPDRYVGIDLDAVYVGGARRRAPGHTFHQMDATSTDFPAGSFDGGLVVGVLHHLDDATAAAVLDELRRVVKPGGRMLIMEQTHSPWTNPIGRFVNHFDKGGFIRSPEEYGRLIGPRFRIARSSRRRSGFVDYVVIAGSAHDSA